MAEEYLIENSNGIARVIFHSKPTLNAVKAATDEFYEKAPYEKRLWDLSGLDLSTKEIIAIARHRRPVTAKPSKIALLGSNDLAYGVLRQFVAHSAPESSPTQVFRNEKEAIAWLNKE